MPAHLRRAPTFEDSVRSRAVRLRQRDVDETRIVVPTCVGERLAASVRR